MAIRLLVDDDTYSLVESVMLETNLANLTMPKKSVVRMLVLPQLLEVALSLFRTRTNVVLHHIFLGFKICEHKT